MKKLLIAFSIIMAAYQGANAQCTPDVSITIPGIYPDTLTNLPPAFENASYGTSIQLRVLTDTVVPQGNVTVTNIVVNSVSGLPAGFSYVCNPVNCTFPGGGNGCVYLTGNPGSATAGTYNITINSTLNGKLFGFVPVSQAFITNGYKIVIHGKPTPNFSALPTSICKGGSTQLSDASSDLPNSWNWTFTGGTPATSTLQNPVVTYNTTGVKNVTLTVGNPAGSNTLTKSSYITVNGLPNSTITLTGNDTICSGDTAKMVANSGTGLTYQWKLGTADIIGATSKNYNTIASGSYKVLVTNSNGCTKLSTALKIVKSSAIAAITPTGTVTFCAGQSATLTANGGSGLSYKWKRNGVTISGAISQSYSATTAGSYKAVVTNYLGCSKTSNTVTVSVPCREDGVAFEQNGYALYPNPASENAYLDFNLTAKQKVTVTLYDLTGRELSTIAADDFEAGNNQLIVKTNELNNGIYFVKINSSNENQTLKLNVQH